MNPDLPENRRAPSSPRRRRRVLLTVATVLAGSGAAAVPLVLHGTAEAASSQLLNVAVRMHLENGDMFGSRRECQRNGSVHIDLSERKSGRVEDHCEDTDGHVNVTVLDDPAECAGPDVPGGLRLTFQAYTRSTDDMFADPNYDTRTMCLDPAQTLGLTLHTGGHTASGAFTVGAGIMEPDG